MAKEILIKPSLCTGCSTCSLACSMQNRGEFCPSRAHIRITKMDFEGRFEIIFSSSCRGCGICAKSCPSGAIKLIELPEAAG
ncbi:MAG: 4Fe-4S binding protein [Peptococcaceae bacterium]|nr:4Fe-4S binding protein [Peptococcaceae bacterium]